MLSAMVLEPIRWNERFGWRRWIEAERLALFHFWSEVGAPDGDPRAPGHARGARRAEPRGRADALRADTGRPPPRALADGRLHRLVPGRAVRARRARDRGAARGARRRGARPAPPDDRRAARGRGRAAPPRAALRAFPPRRKPRLRTTMRRRSYPAGWALEMLGPPPASDGVGGYAPPARPRSSEDRAADFESACGGSIPPGAIGFPNACPSRSASGDARADPGGQCAPVATSATSRKSARLSYSTSANRSTREPLEDLPVPVRRRAEPLLERFVLSPRVDVFGDRVADCLLDGHAVDCRDGRRLVCERRRQSQREGLRLGRIGHGSRALRRPRLLLGSHRAGGARSRSMPGRGRATRPARARPPVGPAR